jgi:putative N6-adenine-specific DNA methylase
MHSAAMLALTDVRRFARLGGTFDEQGGGRRASRMPVYTFGAVEFFASAAKGTEPALRDELRELRFRGVRADRGGVHFEGAWEEGYRACLWSRIAQRVLAPLARFDAASERDLYDGVRSLDFSYAIDSRRTLAVSAACRSSGLTHTHYVSQLTKDAIVDRIRDRTGGRPDVDRRDPDVHIFVHLVRDVATIYLDLAGEPLHRRGYRDAQAEAPLRETLAAAVIRYSGWDRRSPFVDPLCGSGTLLIEAALLARAVAPGLARRRFGFERWAAFGPAESARLNELRVTAREAVRSESPPLVGSDASAQAIEGTRASARRAAVELNLRVASLDALRLPSGPGTLVTNPPYGRRLERGAGLERELSRLIDAHPEWNAALLLSADDSRTRTHRRPTQVRPVFNGDIECDLRIYAAKDAAPGASPT